MLEAMPWALTHLWVTHVSPSLAIAVLSSQLACPARQSKQSVLLWEAD